MVEKSDQGDQKISQQDNEQNPDTKGKSWYQERVGKHDIAKNHPAEEGSAADYVRRSGERSAMLEKAWRERQEQEKEGDQQEDNKGNSR